MHPMSTGCTVHALVQWISYTESLKKESSRFREYAFIYTICLGMYTLATLIGRRIDALSPNLRENLSERSFDTWA